MLVHVKNLPQLKLADLLRRKKMTLKRFIDESGVQTYASLVMRCERIGVLPPSESDFRNVMPEQVSSPSDGLIVLSPIVDDEAELVDEPDADKPRKRRKKKENDEPK